MPYGNCHSSTNSISWFLILKCSGSSTTNFDEKMSAKLLYLLGTSVGASSTLKCAIWALLEWYILSPESILRVATCTTKASYSRSRTAAANSFFSINSTCLVVGSTFSVMKDLYCKSWAWKSRSAFFIVRKSILHTISGLTLANKTLSSKDLCLPFLSNTEKVETTIL